MSFLDPDWKPFHEMTDDERRAAGWVDLGKGQWKKLDDIVPRADPDGCPVVRDFDSGVVPDLHHPTSAAAWERLGKKYVPGVGPVIRSNAELRDFCEISGMRPKGMTSTSEEDQYGLYGFKMKRKRKVKKEGRIDDVWERFRRDRGEVAQGLAAHESAIREERAIQEARARAARGRGKFYSVP